MFYEEKNQVIGKSILGAFGVWEMKVYPKYLLNQENTYKLISRCDHVPAPTIFRLRSNLKTNSI